MLLVAGSSGTALSPHASVLSNTKPGGVVGQREDAAAESAGRGFDRTSSLSSVPPSLCGEIFCREKPRSTRRHGVAFAEVSAAAGVEEIAGIRVCLLRNQPRIPAMAARGGEEGRDG